MKEWRARGVTYTNDEPVPEVDRSASIIVPAGHTGPAFLIFQNFRAILRYNNSTAYALAIGLIADQVAGGTGVKKAWPRDLEPLSRDDRKEMQMLLTKQGYPSGGIDGIIGGKTRSAIRDFQKQNGLVADGFATLELLERLRGRTDAPAQEDPAAAEAPSSDPASP